MLVATYGEAQISYLLPGVQTAINQLRREARERYGIYTKVNAYGGARTETIVQQLIRWRNQAVAAGEPWYRVAPYGVTKHALGGAADLAVVVKPDGMTYKEAYAILGRICGNFGLIWGGTFTAPADQYHFESQQSIVQLRPRWNTWIKSADFPRTGWMDPEFLLYLVALAVLLYFLFRR